MLCASVRLTARRLRPRRLNSPFHDQKAEVRLRQRGHVGVVVRLILAGCSGVGGTHGPERRLATWPPKVRVRYSKLGVAKLETLVQVQVGSGPLGLSSTTSVRVAPWVAGVVRIKRLLDGPNQGADTKFSDLNMLVMPGGRERFEAEFAQPVQVPDCDTVEP